jgi:Chaperone of endosialidase
MSEVTVEQDSDIIVVRQDDLTRVMLEDTTEIIQTLDQGPPGIQGPQGDQGVPGPEGVGEAPMDGRTYGRKVAEWVPFGGVTSVQVGDTAPANAPDNSLWFETDSGLLFLKYNDGTSSQWVVTPKVGGLVDAPADGNSYGRLNGDWAQVAPLVSPAFTGNPIAPTPAAGNNGPSIATTAFVQSAVAAGGGGGGTGGGGGGLTPASNVIVTPTGQIAATDAQAAFAELDSEKVAKAGDTMTGPLTLSGAPSLGGHATTKDYVDTGDAARVAKAGDQMTGALTLSGAPTLPNQAATKDYVDTTSGAALASKVAKAGDVMTGLLTLSGAPTAANHAATKSYVDGGDNARVAKGGDTMSGLLTLSGAPTAGGHATTKDYVDATSTGKVAKAGDTMSGSLTIQANLTVSGVTSLAATTVNGVLTVASNVVNSTQYRMNGTTNALIFDGTNNIIRQSSGTYFQKGDGSANLAWLDTNGNFNAVGNIAAYGILSTNGYVVVGGSGGGSIYLGTSYSYSIQCNSLGKFSISGSCTFAGSVQANNSGAFSPSNVDAASFIGWGAYGGGLTLQDGGARASIWTSAGNMALATGASNPPTVRLQLSDDGNHVFIGTLNINGPLLNIYGNNFYLLNSLCITRTAPFTTLCDDQGNQRIILGNSNSASTYHRNVYHNFQDPSGNQYFGIDPGGIHLAVGDAYKPGGGAWVDSSDLRVKDVLGKYEQGLDQILALDPVRFTYKGNDTISLPVAIGSQAPQRSTHLSVTGREFIGLVAQDAEVPMPELVSQRDGYIDGEPVSDLRMLDTSPLVFALINAVKTLSARNEAAMSRIDALEKRLASHV